MNCGICCVGEPERSVVEDEVCNERAPTVAMAVKVAEAEDTDAAPPMELQEQAAKIMESEEPKQEVCNQLPAELLPPQTKQERSEKSAVDGLGEEVNNAEPAIAPKEESAAAMGPKQEPEASAPFPSATSKQLDYYNQQSERSQEPHHSDNQQPPTNLLQALLYRSSEPDNPQLTGVRICDDAIKESPMAKPQNLGELRKGFARTLKRLPGHFARELLLVFPPVFVSITYMILMGLLNRMFRKAIPNHAGSLKELEFRAGEMDLGTAMLGCVGSVTFVLALAIGYGLMAAVLWRKRVVNAWLKFYPAWVSFNIALFVARPIMMAKSDRPDVLDRMIFLANCATLLVAMCGHFYCVGKDNENPFFWKMLAFLFGTVAGVYYLYRNIMQSILVQSNVFKIFFCGIVNPFVAQLFQVVPARLAARSFHHNDPSTSWMLPQMILVFEKAYSRLVIASMQSIVHVGIASLASTAGSGLVLLMVGKEDVRIYQLLGWITGRRDACANILCARNMAFRTSLYCFDFCTELTMILAFGCFYLAYDVQRADGTKPEVAHVIPAVLIQLVLQVGSNAVQILWVTLKQGVDYVVFARWRCQWWSLITIPCLVFPLTMMCASMFVQLLCAAPQDGDTHWVICGAEQGP
jgi:hypothetical protein